MVGDRGLVHGADRNMQALGRASFVRAIFRAMSSIRRDTDGSTLSGWHRPAFGSLLAWHQSGIGSVATMGRWSDKSRLPSVLLGQNVAEHRNHDNRTTGDRRDRGHFTERDPNPSCG